MLITKRWLETARRLTYDTNIIDLHAEKDYDVRILKSKLPRTEDSAGMGRLATALDYMPLATTQAVAYKSRARHDLLL